MKIRLVSNGMFTTIEDINETLIPSKEGFYWIDADVEDLAILQPLFSMHDLAVEDCLSEEEQRPKIEIYESHYFIVINSIRFDDEEIFLRALNIFLGRHFIITVTKQKINELRSLKPVLWEQEVSRPIISCIISSTLLSIIISSLATVLIRASKRLKKIY